MKLSLIAAPLLLLALPAIPAAAQDGSDLASKLVNNFAAPSVNGAKASLVDDPNVDGGKALRVVVPKKGDNNWDSTVESAITKPVKAGDHLVLQFQARLEKGDGGATTATLPYNTIQLNAAPYTGIVSGQATVGPNWTVEKIEGTANKNYAPGDLKASIQIGNAKQTIDFGPIMVFDMGPNG